MGGGRGADGKGKRRGGGEKRGGGGLNYKL